MSVISRSVVYSLLTVVLVLLVGIAALLGVAYYRHQRLADETIDLRRNLTQQQGQINTLQRQLQDCDTLKTVTPADTSWNTSSPADSGSIVSHVVHVMMPISR